MVVVLENRFLHKVFLKLTKEDLYLNGLLKSCISFKSSVFSLILFLVSLLIHLLNWERKRRRKKKIDKTIVSFVVLIDLQLIETQMVSKTISKEIITSGIILTTCIELKMLMKLNLTVLIVMCTNNWVSKLLNGSLLVMPSLCQKRKMKMKTK